jgi:chromosomal replication initiator protein
MHINAKTENRAEPGRTSPARWRVSDPFVSEVLGTVAADFGMTAEEMLIRSRGFGVWKPRLAAMYFCRLLTGCSLPELGRVFGGRSHTTVLRAFHRCRELMDKDPQWAERMDKLLVVLVEKLIATQG